MFVSHGWVRDGVAVGVMACLGMSQCAGQVRGQVPVRPPARPAARAVQRRPEAIRERRRAPQAQGYVPQSVGRPGVQAARPAIRVPGVLLRVPVPMVSAPPRPPIPLPSDSDRSPMVADLEKRANAGDVRAECLLGRAYSVGDGLPAHRADIPRAVTWLNKAAGQGDVEAVYLLGSLMAGGQALVRGPSGVVGPDPQRGRQMMNEALQRGYNPATGAVTPPETARASSGDGGDGALAVGALLLGLVVLAASASGGQGSSADANGSDVIDDMEAERRDRWSKRACMIPTTMTMMNPDGTETEVPDSREGFGFECPEY